MAAESVVPRPVYFISGHGNERPGNFIIPFGCEIIVKSNTCTLAFTTDFNNMLNALLFMDERLIRNPIGNMNELIKMLGSVSVFTRNQPRVEEHRENFRYHRPTLPTCPNFNYHLLNAVFKENEHGKLVSIDDTIGSGILDLFRVREAKKEIPHTRLIIYDPLTPKGIQAAYHHKNTNIAFIVSLYQYSIYPTPNTIETYLTMRWREERAELYDMLYDLNRQIFINVSQEYLCYSYPGVYYHTVCRAIPHNINESAQKDIKQWNNWKRGDAKVSVAASTSNPLFARRAFMEAALRRNYLRQYQDTMQFEERQHITNKKNCRNLETRIATIEDQLKIINESNASNEVKKREKDKIIKNTHVRLLRNILHNKSTKCARREVALRGLSRSKNQTRRTRNNRSRSPKQNRKK